LAEGRVPGLTPIDLPPEVYECAGQGWASFFEVVAQRLAGE
jgi:hypothetical protein